MNYLAHAYLSGENRLLLVGNMMGDAIKGNGFLDDKSIPKDVVSGIKLHRFIDDYTDNHPICIQGKKRLWDKYRHFSGVLTDMYYDHLLAVNWKNYSDQRLKEFASEVYGTLNEKKHLLPERTREMVYYMEQYNWLESYASIEGISRALGGLSRRTIKGSGIEEGTNELITYFDDYQDEFNEFFEDIRKACEEQIAQYE